MNIYIKLALSLFLLSLSQLAIADCDSPDALPNCHQVIGDKPTFDMGGSGGGGIIFPGGGGSSTGGSAGGSSGTGSSGGATTPSDPPKSPRTICLESSSVSYATCNAQTSADYSSFFKTYALGKVAKQLEVELQYLMEAYLLIVILNVKILVNREGIMLITFVAYLKLQESVPALKVVIKGKHNEKNKKNLVSNTFRSYCYSFSKLYLF